LEESIVPQLVSAGVFAILRFSLDDNVTMVVQAAAEALNHLLSSEPDEVYFKFYFLSHSTIVLDAGVSFPDFGNEVWVEAANFELSTST